MSAVAVYDQHFVRQVSDHETPGGAWAFLREGMFANLCYPVGVVVDGEFEAWTSDRALEPEFGDR